MKIYTKNGDRGQTTLVDGSPIAKSDARLKTYGTVDELNAHVGLLQTMLDKEAKLNGFHPQLFEIQNWLFQLGSQLACGNSEFSKKLPTISDKNTTQLESWMDQWDQELPELKNFILPGGHEASAQAHVCRTVARRAERACVVLDEMTELSVPAIAFLNRLSDYFFMISRSINQKMDIDSVIWNP